MRKFVVIIIATLLGCAQSTVVFDPVQNKPPVVSTSPTQGSVTANINLSVLVNAPNNKVLGGQIFSILLFQDGVVKAAIPGDGSGTTNASGVASVALKAMDASNCVTGTSASLPNGTYQYYFTINYNNGANRTYASTGNTGTSCGAGYLQYSDATYSYAGNTGLFTSRGTITVQGDTSFTINHTNAALSGPHTFDVSSAGAGNYACYVTDPSTVTYSSTIQLVSYYARTGAGSMTGNAGNTHYLPNGVYKYFCYRDVNSAGGFFQTGIDRVAIGTLTVNGANTTYLGTGDFALQ
ncbi:MAG: hypothetical protein KF713_04525 [Turneriella sp.]|nr:hypothetical protein [Turneriella sp.]